MIGEGFTQFVEQMKDNRERKLAGKSIGVPFRFPRLDYKLGGIQKKQVIHVTANSGLGKSKLTRFLFIYSVYAHYLTTGYPVRIMYFPLEDSLEEIIGSMVSYRLQEKYGIRIAHTDLLSQRMAVTADVVAKVEECWDYFSRLESVLEVYDGRSAPSEIRDICINEASRWGTIEYFNGRVTGYKPTQEMHLFVIIDNYVNFTLEQGLETTHKAIGHMSQQVLRLELAKHIGYTVVGVVQQESGKEKINVKQDGEIVVPKLLPSTEGYGNNKEIQRDAHLILGLFSPNRYKIPRFPVETSKDNSYDILRLGNFFRSLHVVKNNKGPADFFVPLFFDGSTELYQEMPLLTDVDRVQRMYNHVDKLNSEQASAPLLFG